MTTEDIRTVGAALLENYRRVEVTGLMVGLTDRFAPLLADVAEAKPGEQGSVLGDEVSHDLNATRAGWVDIDAVLAELEIRIVGIDLSDSTLRAITAFGPNQPPVVYRNDSFTFAHSEGPRRFMLAHELCHLIFDREAAGNLAVASGPWAPLNILSSERMPSRPRS